jgi:hypothetical protein
MFRENAKYEYTMNAFRGPDTDLRIMGGRQTRIA